MPTHEIQGNARGPMPPIYLVVGPMRSGTSMLMRCLEAGGLPVYRNPSRDRHNAPRTGGFQLNPPGGLYELEAKDFEATDFAARAAGHAVKVVFPWLALLPTVEGVTYRAVLLERHPEELRQAQEAARFSDESAAFFVQRYAAIRAALTTRGISDVTTLAYHELVRNPLRELSKLADWPIDVAAAASVPDPRHYTMRFAYGADPDPRFAANLVEGL